MEIQAGSTRRVVTCPSCRTSYAVADAPFCSCITKTPTLLCPNCLQCFCNAPGSFIKSFWASAPDELWRRRNVLRQRRIAAAGEGEAGGLPLVLVIDDDPDVQAAALHVLTTLGYEVALAGDGVEGLQRARSLKPALVLTDALLPRIDGREVCLAIKSDPLTAKIPVVVMSAVYREARYHSEAIKHFGADDFVVKPLDVVELQHVLTRFLVESHA